MDVVVRRRGESLKSIVLGGVPIHLLVRSEGLESMIVEMPPGAGIPKVYSHEGEEVRIVLEGELEVEVSGERYLLKEGDTMWFRSEQPHAIRNPGTRKAVYFSVNIPPSLSW
ncbi:MAG: cupin domain-containing protein [Euryarchaeota archaeon]|nr:cupin domain-containing protein [Euryarchaeota archaeon]